MEHLRAILIKFVLVTAMLSIVLGFLYGVSFGDILTISIVLTIAAYLLGDMLVLPRSGNTMATLADFGLAYAITWLVGAAVIEEPIRLGVASFLSAVLISIGEVFFHRYLENNIIDDNERMETRKELRPSYQTEMAEESFPELREDRNTGEAIDEEFAEEILPETIKGAGNANQMVGNSPNVTSDVASGSTEDIVKKNE